MPFDANNVFTPVYIDAAGVAGVNGETQPVLNMGEENSIREIMEDTTPEFDFEIPEDALSAAIDAAQISLYDKDVMQIHWVQEALNTKILPLLATKTRQYGASIHSMDSEFHTISGMAERSFPKEYAENKYFAMIKIVNILIDKHNMALAQHVNKRDDEERICDCIVYDFIRLRLIVMGKQLEAQKTEGASNASY